MKDLFITLNVEKTSAYYTNVPTEISEWPKAALSAFLHEFPEFTNEDLGIDLYKKDEEQGYAIGAIKFREGTLAVPIIIKEWQLAPFDIIMTAEHTLPLTHDNLASLFSNRNAYAGLSKATGEIFPAVFDPSLRSAGSPGSYTYSLKTASSIGDFSFIDSVSDSVGSKAKKALLDIIYKDLETQSLFKKNDTYEIVEKIANLSSNDSIDVSKVMSRSLPRDIHYIYKVAGTNQYTGIFGNSTVYDIVTKNLTEDDLKSESFVKCAEDPKPMKKKKSKHKCSVFNIHGDTQNKLIINSEGKYAEFSINSRYSDEYEVNDAELVASYPKTDHKYVILVKSAENEVTRPVDVLSVVETDGKACITVFDGFKKHSYYVTRGINGIYDHDTEKNASYIGENVKFYEITDKFTPEIEKIAVVEEIYRTSEQNYVLRGPNFEKYANSYVIKPEYSFHDAVWCVLQHGGQYEDLYKLGNLKVGYSATFENLNPTPAKIGRFINKIAEEYKNSFDSVEDVEYLTNLVKIAAKNPMKTTVDAVLSLGLLNKNNLEEYVSNIPMYEQATTDLAKLLLHIRLGLGSIDEQAVSKAMKELVKVTENLRSLQKLSKVT